MYVSVIHLWPTAANFYSLAQATLRSSMAEGAEQELREAHDSEEEEEGIPELRMLPCSNHIVLGGVTNCRITVPPTIIN